MGVGENVCGMEESGGTKGVTIGTGVDDEPTMDDALIPILMQTREIVEGKAL